MKLWGINAADCHSSPGLEWHRQRKKPLPARVRPLQTVPEMPQRDLALNLASNRARGPETDTVPARGAACRTGLNPGEHGSRA